jgi:hypothetical protein
MERQLYGVSFHALIEVDRFSPRLGLSISPWSVRKLIHACDGTCVFLGLNSLADRGGILMGHCSLVKLLTSAGLVVISPRISTAIFCR